MNPQTPPGWYPDPSGSGQQRYFDGTQWTGHAAPGQQPPAPKKSKTGWIVAGVLAAVLLLLIGVGVANSPSPSTQQANQTVTPTASARATSAPSIRTPDTDAPTASVEPAPTTTSSGQVTYEVHSDGPLMTVSYFDALNNMTQLSNQPADWTTSFTGKATYQMHSMSAQTKGEQVSCKITVDGTVVASDSASGRYAVVVCSG